MMVVSDEMIERRCRYRLARHGLRMHKVQGASGPYYYCYENGTDDTAPDSDTAYFTLDKLLDYCERLKEREAE